MSSKTTKHEIDKIVKKKITYKCPVRGLVTQEVNVTIYKSPEPQEDFGVDPDVALLLGGTNVSEDLEEGGFHEVED